MGEPMANLDALLSAWTPPPRRTASASAPATSPSRPWLPAKIRRLADLGKKYHLAVSLHAPNDVLRTRIVPTNDKTGLGEDPAAADYYFARTGRQVTYEYVLLGERQRRPGAVSGTRPAAARRPPHVNLIPSTT